MKTRMLVIPWDLGTQQNTFTVNPVPPWDLTWAEIVICKYCTDHMRYLFSISSSFSMCYQVLNINQSNRCHVTMKLWYIKYKGYRLPFPTFSSAPEAAVWSLGRTSVCTDGAVWSLTLLEEGCAGWTAGWRGSVSRRGGSTSVGHNWCNGLDTLWAMRNTSLTHPCLCISRRCLAHTNVTILHHNLGNNIDKDMIWECGVFFLLSA